MKYFLAALVFMSAINLSYAESGAGWATATSVEKSTGRVMIFRYIRDFAPQFLRSDYPDRVIIVWQYQSASGMPQQAERENMDRLEDLLSSKLEAASLATLALVSTGENMREWIYYTKSEADFIAQLNSALGNKEPFPIETHAAPDPEWKSYEDFRAGVRE
jgi:hypothetical protein